MVKGMRLPDALCFALPAWLRTWAAELTACVNGDAAAMALAVEASRRNVAQGGGPFGAILLDGADGRLLGLGVNLVVPESASVLHAEITALLVAQRAAGTHDLRRGGSCDPVLYSSAEPCAMCMGALPWAGIRRLVCGARDEDVRAVGFDEGDKPRDWVGGYARRGIRVTRDVLRSEACAVLRAYVDGGGALY